MRVSRASQRGVALVVTLLLLVVLALMGVSAMRMSMFNARIATGAQLSAMTFTTAESSLASTYNEVVDTNSIMLLSLLDGETVRRCQKANDAQANGTCAEADRFDSRGLLQAQSRTDQLGVSPDFSLLEGAQLNGQQLLVPHRMEITAVGEAPDFQTASYHVQEFNVKAMTDPGTLIAQTKNN
ncbi:PilX N-terminal domain-containing pilus assembly protein [Alcanivorax sp. S6407]|uniref:PilX N-terminal domain-containing pilus assembly protein n=1 Tax=Alcanivorax sp. S6407 TaxID=2926424 RepID=UPI001FF1A636|nr:PilX N-terminal domain-containing pilus assembly protein [Alcanivorax sp. S6407]MCK0155200.1 PilX N-terminal domain-containing pilus assembly protein [Alcanivorax sp. S6407]